MHADVAFRLTDPRRPLLIVPVHVNGEGPFEFLVDTGASRTFIFDPLADRLDLARGEAVQGHGAGGPVQFALGQVDSIAVGAARAEAVPICIGALDVIAQHVSPLPGGVLGYTF